MTGSDRAPVIGVTGRPCSGKSEVARIMGDLGARVIDVDAVGHKALAGPEVSQAVKERFGNGVIDSDGSVNRNALGNIVFGDAEALRDLEAILHPRMRNAVREIINNARQPVVLDAALLGPIGLDEFCQRIVLVDAPEQDRIDRATKRGWTESTLAVRNNRIDEGLEALGNKPDVTLNNNQSLERLQERVAQLWKEWIDACQEENIA